LNFLFADLKGLNFGIWPGELVPLQALHPKAETVAIPVDDFQEFSVSATEQKQRTGERIELHGLLGDGGEPGYLLAHISDAGAKVDFYRAEINVHFRSATHWMTSLA
jgi:predicted alpha/beta-fold hydrolase